MIRLLAGWQNGDGTMKETTFEERLGYMVYTEQFAGNLEGVREHLEYLRELGVNYLHLMPLLESRQEIYWEHFGMMDDPDYALKAIKRIMEYQKNGIYPGQRLIITFESFDSPLDPKHVEQIAEKLVSGGHMIKAGKPDISLPPGFGIWSRSSEWIFSGQGQQIQ